MKLLPVVGLVLLSVGCKATPQPPNPPPATPDAATIKKHMTAEQLALGEPIRNDVGMLLVPIPSGEFAMGNPHPESIANAHERPQHSVRITRPFYLSAFEVTQEQYEKVMGGHPWRGKSTIQEGPDYPATHVTWHEAVEFCSKLSEREGVEYFLPTESQWEYACRSGTTTDFSFGEDPLKIEQHAWYAKNTVDAGEKYPHRVGQKLPNAFGLYDMHGNTWEWCHDWFGYYSARNVSDPKGPLQGQYRVMRGGAYSNISSALKSYNRQTSLPSNRFNFVGFRPARVYGPQRVAQESNLRQQASDRSNDIVPGD